MDTLKPSQVLRLIKKGVLPGSIDGGHPICLKCDKINELAGTESPDFWENGLYCRCRRCGEHTLHGAVYPATDNFPSGIKIDTSGERKKYPMTIKV